MPVRTGPSPQQPSPQQSITRLVLVRHTESVRPAAGEPIPLLDGQGDPELTAAGHDQAERIASRLGSEKFDALYTSPMRRTVQTAQPLATTLGLTPIIESDLRDVHLGEWEAGMLLPQYVAEGHPVALRVFSEQRWDVIPGAEARTDFTARVRAVVERITASRPGSRLALFTHATVISELFAIATGARPLAFLQSDYGSLSELMVLDSGWYVRSFNDTAHLAAGPKAPLT